MGARLLDPDGTGRQVIDRYELVAEIASGGMATVYLARLGGVGGFTRFFAIKRLHPHLASEPEFVDMFLDEARLAAGIRHQNVVPILEVGASSRGYYIVMEYIEGDTLGRLLARASTAGNALPRPIALRIVVDMLSGLHAAHELEDEAGQPTGLVHRDVSPQNVLVGIDGVCRITDFGVARAATRLSGTRVGQLKGKIAYMAPEQAMGLSDLDRRADVFASGIVLWEVLAQRRLFKSVNEAATLSRVISDPIPALTAVNPEIPKAVSDVAARALDRERTGRFPTAAAFADALEAAALEAGELASSKELAAYVVSVLGDEIEQQREAVRGWLARSEPSHSMVSLPHGLGPVSSVSASSMTLPQADRSGVTLSAPGTPASLPMPSLAQPPPRRGLLVAAVLLLLLLVGGGLFMLGRTSGSPTAAGTATSRADKPPEPSAVVKPAAMPSAPPSVAPSASATPPTPEPSKKPIRQGRPRGDDLPSNPYR